ncbi:hypothetical protein T11_9442 [Trichinella zimbabwensis]|uniref:Uncharacterized protein n=1 Tax=Trichinella zimbabwensis TaxID=268475 RepID=A0A0V1HLJ3_9BILA|nr:hypothetical protein T11_9442 [Trichinella zimbabwensis]
MRQLPVRISSGQTSPGGWQWYVKRESASKCLQSGHRAQACRDRRRCAVARCGRAHHELLHGKKPTE